MRSLSLFALVTLLTAAALGASAVAYWRGRSVAGRVRPYSIRSTAGSYPRVLEASDGTVVTLAAPPHRVLALALSVEEIIVALRGVDVLAGVSRFSRLGHYSNIAAAVSGVPITVVGTDTEQILRIGPDLILVTRYTPPRVRSMLEGCGLAVFPLPDPRDLAAIRETLRLVGSIFDREDAARELLARMELRLDAIRRATPGGPPPRVLYLAGAHSLWVAGSGTVIGEVIALAGCTNIASEEGVENFREVNRERLIRWNPDWILLEGSPDDEVSLAGEFSRDTALARLEAIVAGRVAAIPAHTLGSVSHHVIDAVELLFRRIHGIEVQR